MGEGGCDKTLITSGHVRPGDAVSHLCPAAICLIPRDKADKQTAVAMIAVGLITAPVLSCEVLYSDKRSSSLGIRSPQFYYINKAKTRLIDFVVV